MPVSSPPNPDVFSSTLAADIYSAEAFEARVRERFQSRADVLSAIGGDQTLNPDYAKVIPKRTFKSAAVLIPVLVKDERASVLLTLRAAHLNSHKGQIAFPGGKIDPGETPEQAALREAWEEVGLQPHTVDVLGTFGTYFSGSGYSIEPVVGIVREAPQLRINEDEVAEAFEVPLAFLMNEASHRLESRTWNEKGVEKERFFYAMPYRDDGVDPPVERRIWGVTAGIIRMVQERLYGGVSG